jgi:hypothetical protein
MAERHYTDADLAALAARAPERMAQAIATADAAAIIDTYDAIEDARRGFAATNEEWAALTVAYLVSAYGTLRASGALRLERTAAIAAGLGLGADELALVEAVLDGPLNPLRERIAAAALAGDLGAVGEAWEQADRLTLLAGALRNQHISDLLGHVYREHGADALEAALRFAADHGSFWKAALPAQAAAAPEELIAGTAFFLAVGADCSLALIEEPERFVVEFLDCHCGRQIADARAHGWGVEVVEGPSPLTYGLAAVSPYQAHFAVIHGSWAIDLLGAPAPAFDCVGMALGSRRCRNYVYKGAVPARFYEALGREAPPNAPELDG